MIAFREATDKNIKALSKNLQRLLKDKKGQVYRENVTKFGIPEEYARQAISEKTLLEAAATGKATFYIALENDRKILGFAQIIRQNTGTAELDRIIVFPEYTGKGIGTRLLTKALSDQKRKGIKTIIVRTGKNETQARKFYERNGFKQTAEMTMDTPWGKKLDLVTYQVNLDRE
jgi:N-acetylglutamate synthase-like GNAT family acetyltransferase